MSEPLWAAAGAVWLGVLTSISPCPLATNIAAVSYISRDLAHPLRVLRAGLLYTAGRALAYAGLGAVLVSSLLSAPLVSGALQHWMSRLIGPLLILAGMVLLELLRPPVPQRSIGASLRRKAESLGALAPFALGVLFALSFCPISAALFFGNLIPLAIAHGSSLGIPSLYGVGTALPVIVFAGMIALGAKSLSRAFGRVSTFELWARRVTGLIFIGAGIYLALANIFGLFG